jgi:taurine-pyruvate aminotransferase
MFELLVNGKHVVSEKNERLMDFLRDRLLLKSVKNGCAQGACGTCTILIDGKASRACTVTTEKVFAGLQVSGDKLAYFRDISTFGGCAAAPAAALENIRIIEREKLLANVTAMGEYLMAGLQESLSHPNVGDVRGKGLLAGIEFVTDKASKQPLPEEKVIAVCGEMAANGVLVGRTNRSFPGQNNIINFAPAYVVTRADMDVILKTLREALGSVLG